ncbi:MAG: hypothetical protein AAF680_09820 [Pseudomonadota bacterium]
MKGKPLVTLLAAPLLLLQFACSDRVVLPQGILAPEAPMQTVLPAERVLRNGVALSIRADFSLRAKLLAKRRYRWDELAKVAPWDFALGWGPMSDEMVLSGIAITQGDRFLFWKRFNSTLELEVVEQHSANLHLIPANAAIEETLAAIPEGALLSLQGKLVDVHLADKRIIPTSLSRSDRGAGACEILLVEEVERHVMTANVAPTNR